MKTYSIKCAVKSDATSFKQVSGSVITERDGCWIASVPFKSDSEAQGVIRMLKAFAKGSVEVLS